MTSKRSKRRGRLLVQMLLGVVLGVLFSIGSLELLQWIDLPRVRVTGPWTAVGLVLLAYYTSIVLHESGHGLTAVAMRMRVFMFGVGPLLLFRSPTGALSARWFPRLLLGGFTGAVFRDGKFRRGAMAAVIFAGPLTSLTLALSSLGVLKLGPGPQDWELFSSWLASTSFFLLFLAYFALFHFVFSALPIPGKASFCYTDGKQLLRLLSRSTEVMQWRAVQTISHLTLSSVRPRDWPVDLVEALESRDEPDPTSALGWSLAFTYAWDARLSPGEVHRRFERAVARLEELAPMLQAGSRVTLAFYESWVRRNAPAAREWLKGSRSPFVDAFHYKKVEAALALVEGDLEAAARAVEETRALMKRARFPITADEGEHVDALAAAVADARARQHALVGA